MSDGVRLHVDARRDLQGRIFPRPTCLAEIEDRDAFLLRVMGSPDPRQIDGMGGADPLTSKVAVVHGRSARGRCRLPVSAGLRRSAVVTDGRTAATSSPASALRDRARSGSGAGRRDAVRSTWKTPARSPATVVQTPGGKVTYEGDASHRRRARHRRARCRSSSSDTAGSTCGALLPTGNAVDVVEGVEVTMIDNGMPCVVCALPTWASRAR
jgi:4-oxalomesaconate tautomerase